MVRFVAEIGEVGLTSRLDNSLYSVFMKGASLVGHVHHAESADELRELLRNEAGQIIFSTMKSSVLKTGKGSSRSALNAGTLSSPMKPIAHSTISRDLPATCVVPCRMPHTSPLPVRPSPSRTGIRLSYSAM